MLDYAKSTLLDGMPDSMVDMTTLAERVRQARLAAGFDTQSALGEAIGRTRSAINQIESGATQNLKLETLWSIAEKCDVDMDWLVTGRGTMAGLSQEERELAEAIKDLPAHQRHAFQALLGPSDEHGGNGGSAEGAG